ncbi:MAG: 3'(2'), 5'-bisphosphate nucleotidase [Planctomycetota bacterium]|jgi:3'(2'), 5'-bisphosphate nucleotidase
MSTSPTTESIAADLAFAKMAAQTAGDRILALVAQERWEGKMLADVGDQAADGYLQGLFAGRYPDDGILSEETKDSEERLAKHRCWIIDPLDGTREFSQLRHDWAVHVGLTFGGECGLAAVALPNQKRMMWAVTAPGHEAYGMDGDGEMLRGDSTGPATPRVACSRSHTPDWVENFVTGIGGEKAPAGSVGNKVSMLLLGNADVYVHKIGLKEWDTCAPEVIARALGWSVCKLRGDEHRYNQRDPYNNELVICRPAMKAQVLEVLAGCGALED